MEKPKNFLEFSLKSRTNLIAIVSILLGIAKLAYPPLLVIAPAETLILNGLGLLYLREAVGKNAKASDEAAQKADEIDKRRRGIVDG